MNGKTVGLAWLCVTVFSAGLQAETERGVDLGMFRVVPEVRVLGAYDKEGTSEDVFEETEAILRFGNKEARYDLGGEASYGYRAYDEFSDLNGDFYGLSLSAASLKNPLKISITGRQKKTVDYDVRVADGTGAALADVLTRSDSTRSSVRFDVGYEKPVTGNTALMPGYEAWYYKQTFAGAPDAEWQEHVAHLRYGYNLESRVVLSLTGSYGVQLSSLENGTIATVSLGAESRNEEKLSWSVLLGGSAVDYEESGSDSGLDGTVNVRWAATEKISAYLFGGAGFEPGYSAYGGGSARQVYRAGYGAEWAALDRLRVDVQVLHDRQDTLGGGSGQLRHFVSSRISYDVGRFLAITLGGQFINDENDDNRLVLSAGAVATY